MNGLAVCELAATTSTEKSDTAKEYIRHAKAVAMKKSWATAALSPNAIARWSRRAAPANGNANWASAIISARISEKRPISGIIAAPPLYWRGLQRAVCSVSFLSRRSL
jgi:hypothetical protein